MKGGVDKLEETSKKDEKYEGKDLSDKNIAQSDEECAKCEGSDSCNGSSDTQETANEQSSVTEDDGPEQDECQSDAGSANTSSKKKERELSWTKKAKDKKTKEEIDKAKEAAAHAQDRYTRLFAEFDNFRKRTEKEKSQMFDMGANGVVEKILPVIDSFERGLASVSDENKEDPFVVGMDKVYKQMMKVLEGMDIHPIDAVGKEFDPNIHNAVMHVDDESVGENIVVEEFQKGYMRHDTVIRVSMVKVAN